MRHRPIAILLALSLLGAALPASAAKPPTSWDGLAPVKAKAFDYVYLLPGADFRSYGKVMLEPTQVAFRKNWIREYNNRVSKGNERITDEDAQRLMATVRSAFGEILGEAYAEGGYPVVTEAGPDVLLVRTAVMNLSVAAPDGLSPGGSKTYSSEAGGATVVVEVRDSSTGALLGRAVDSRSIGDTGLPRRTSLTNRNDFRQAFRRWAKVSVDGLATLKAMSPVTTAGR